MTLDPIAARVRLLTGLVMTAFVVTHLATHATGLVSLDLMEQVNSAFVAVWRHPLLVWVVPTCLTLHVVLAVAGVVRRKSLKMRRGEAAQLILGMSIPLVLISHVTATRGVVLNFGINLSYTHFFIMDFARIMPALAILVAIAWTHVCLSLHFLMRLKPWYAGVAGPLRTFALLLPVAALLGAVNGGREALRLAADPTWVASVLGELPVALTDLEAFIDDVGMKATGIYVGLILVAFLCRAGVLAVKNRHRSIEIKYDSGVSTRVSHGTTVLEASRLAGIPHAAVCGGHGRCSTCRVRVIVGLESMPPPSLAESKVLLRIGAQPNVRLACQLKPACPVHVTPMLRSATPKDAFHRERYLTGIERDVVILFADLRGFTKFSEQKLPYDVVYILNQYFEMMGEAIMGNGGWLDKFIGDGIMAIFGVECPLKESSRQALLAAGEMGRQLAALNQRLEPELAQPLQMGVGLHCGPAIIGQMGYKHATSLTAIGDTTNTASRLESMTKEHGCQLMVSKAVIDQTGWKVPGLRSALVSVRGRSADLPVYLLDDLAGLSLQAVADSIPTAPRIAA